LAANNKTSPIYDNALSYDLLPSLTRRLISPKLICFYPRLHHANVEIRTAFLDQTLLSIIQTISSSGKKKKIRFLCMGSGYDPRSIKFLERDLVEECWEFDLPNVVEAKEQLYRSKRFRKRRPWLNMIPDDAMENGEEKKAGNIEKKTLIERLHFVSSDLNDVQTLEKKIDAVLTSPSKHNDNLKNQEEDNHVEWYNIFIFEGVMIYLNETIPSTLLSVCSQALVRNNATGSLCFADRLENIPGGDEILAQKEMKRNGWELMKWLPKPGLARHMGFAVPLGGGEEFRLK